MPAQTMPAPPALPAHLARAFGPEDPGPPLPPGPRVNPWDRAGAVPAPVGEYGALLSGLWRAHGAHLRPDGTPTSISRRPVPSAGGCYPVQTHLVLAGRHASRLCVYDHERNRLVERREHPEAGFVDGSWLVFTVLPGRSFGRYRQRAWPLWIADTAYALTAAEYLLGRALPTLLGPGARLRRLLALAPAADTAWWLARGLVPEIPLAALRLPDPVRVDPARVTALAARRSPALSTFTARTPAPHAEAVATRSGQSWVLGADRVSTWTVPTAPSLRLRTGIWQAHRAAARTLIEATSSGRWACRPVSGLRADDGTWLVHALAMLEAEVPS